MVSNPKKFQWFYVCSSQYYRWGAGRARALAPGAVRVGQYCACAYHGDWHRAIIVKIVDSDTVKVLTSYSPYLLCIIK